jgi:hypothetical protein
VWTGSGQLLQVGWKGAPGATIGLGSYGIGPRPTFQLDAQGRPDDQLGLNVSGAHLRLSGLRVTLVNPQNHPSAVGPNGLGVQLGWYVGVSIAGAGVTLDDCEFEHLALGIFLLDSSQACQVRRCHIHDLDCLWRLDGGAGAMGALGVLLRGSDHDVAANVFERNWADGINVSSGAQLSYSAPVEFFNANRCVFRNNLSYDHRKNGEFGKDSAHSSADNRYVGNLVISGRPNGRGPNIHGKDRFGPVERTVVAHNTIVLTGAGSEAVISGQAGATVQDNILVAQAKAAYLKSPLIEAHNLYWGRGVQLTSGYLASTSGTVDPQLDSDGCPREDSPALGNGSNGSDIGAVIVGGMAQPGIPLGEVKAITAMLRKLSEGSAAQLDAQRALAAALGRIAGGR